MISMWGLMAHAWEAETERLGNRGPPGLQNETGIHGRSGEEGGEEGTGEEDGRLKARISQPGFLRLKVNLS